jgi:hypothetical protein
MGGVEDRLKMFKSLRWFNGLMVDSKWFKLLRWFKGLMV